MANAVEILTAEGLAEYAKKALVTPNIYVWGGIGEYVTTELLQSKYDRWPEWYIEERREIRDLLANRNLRCWDCIGLIESYTWHDYHQGNTAWYKPEEFLTTAQMIELPGLVKGPIETLPEQPGIVLWKPGHVGVYIGNGEVIESTTRISGTNRMDKRVGGVIHSTFTETNQWPEMKWQMWVQYPGIRY